MTSVTIAKGARRGEILERATQLFAEKGYEGASMSDLALAVGLRKASLFHHFASKEEIYTAVLEGLLESVHGVITAAEGSDASFKVRTDALVDALVETFGHRPYAARLLLREIMSEGPIMKSRLAPLIAVVLGAGKSFSERGQVEGVFAAEVDPSHMVISVVGIILVPFAVHEVVADFVGKSAFSDAFIADRKREVKTQLARFLSPKV